jgi:hypothetical protein
MQKTTDILTSVSMPTEKYSNIEEFIMARFTIEKTVQLLHRSASYLASNSSKMADWVNFIDNGFSGLCSSLRNCCMRLKTSKKLKKT